MTLFQDDPRAEIHVFQRDTRLDGRSDGLVHLLLLVGGGPLPVGATDCPMDADAFPHPRVRLHHQVNHISVQSSLLSRVSKAKWKTGSTGYDTFGALALGFYNEAATHLPFVMAVHNLWRAKLLYSLNYGQPNFRSRDSKKVQEILFEAGKGSYAESMYEAGPQSVTQVLQSN